jgi:hypothetical protein
MAIALRKEEEKDEPTGGGGKYLMNRLLRPPQEAQGAGLAAPAAANTAPPSIANPVHNKAAAVENIATRQGARRELAGQSPVALPSQQFPTQDLTEARHATPFVAGQGKAPAGVVENFKYGMNPPGGQTFEQVSTGSANIPPADLVGRSLGNAARAVRGAVGTNPPAADNGQRFPSDLDAAVAAAPRPGGASGSGSIARDFLTQVAAPGQPHNKQRHLDNIAARKGGQQIVASAPVQDTPQTSLSYNVGKFAREQVVPAVDSAARGAVGIATLVPRALYRAGSDAVRGFTGEAPNTEEFSAMPFNSPVLSGSRGTANAADIPAAVPVAVTPQLSANTAAFRNVEAQNPAPQFGMVSSRPDRALDAETYGDQAKIVGGNSPQAMAVVNRGAGMTNNAGITPILTPQDQQLKANMGKIEQMIASGVQPTQQQAVAIDQLRRDAGFLRGGTDRVPVGPDGMPVRGGAGIGGRVPGGVTDSGLSVQFTKNVPDSVRKEVMQPLGVNDPEVQAATAKQKEQFDARNGRGMVKLSQIEEVVGRPLNEFPAGQRDKIINSALHYLGQKGANEAAMANASGLSKHREALIDAKTAALDQQGKNLDARIGMFEKNLEAKTAQRGMVTPETQLRVEKDIAEISAMGINDNNVEQINNLRKMINQPPLVKTGKGDKIKYVPMSEQQPSGKAAATSWLKGTKILEEQPAA